MTIKTRIKQIEKSIKDSNVQHKAFIHIVEKIKDGYLFDNKNLTNKEYEEWKHINDPNDQDSYIILTDFSGK